MCFFVFLFRVILFINQSINQFITRKAARAKYSKNKNRTNVKGRQHEKIRQNFKMWVKT